MASTTTWSAALGYFRTAMKAADRSPGTMRLYDHYLHHLSTRHRRPWAVTTTDLRQLLAAPGWSPSTKKSARSAYRAFYRWAESIGAVERSPAAALEPIRQPRAAARPAPELIARSLIADSDPRIAFMAMLGAWCGLRAGEISRVHANDFAGSRLLVHGKGRHERVVPVVMPALVVRLGTLEGWAFPGRTDGHLSAGHVTRLLSEALPGIWTAHTLRHRAGTNAYRGTRDLLAVAEFLGHAKTDTTRRYIELPDDALRAAAMAAAA